MRERHGGYGERHSGLARGSRPVRRGVHGAVLSLLASAALAGPAEVGPSAPTVAMLPIKLLDTSGEPRDQSVEHRRRLAAMALDLAADLASAGPYRIVTLQPDDVREHCSPETTACILAMARSQGAERALLGVVHKSSTLIMQMWTRIVETRTGRILFSRELNFRGDNDEAWRRAELFLVDQIKADPPGGQRSEPAPAQP